MPLDLFSIARGLKAGQEAYSQGQKEQADRYWSDIENSLKVAASAQELKQATELQPLKALSEQALEFQRRRAGEYSGARATTEEVLRGPSLKLKEEQAFSAEQLGKTREIKAKTDQQILDALQSGYSKFQLENPDSKASYNEWLYQNYPDLGPASEKAKEAVKTQEATTKLRTAQATGAEQKVTTGIEERKTYETLGTTPGAVVAATEIAQMNKAVSDAQKAKIDADNEEAYKKAQIANLLEEKGASGGLKQSSAFTMVTGIGKQMDTLQNRNAIIERAIASITNGNPWEAILQNLTNSGNADANYVGGAVANSTTSDEAITNLRALQQVNNASIAQWGTYANQISDMGGIPKLIVPKPTAQSAGPTATLENDGFLTLNYSDWNSMTAGKKRENIKNWVSRGATKIRLKDPKGDWIADISLEDGQPTISNAQRLASPKVSPPETTTTPTQTTPQAQPKAQAFVQSLKSKGITSVNQLEPDIIQALKNQGIYDQVKTLLGD
jgi:hypothetical protein